MNEVLVEKWWPFPFCRPSMALKWRPTTFRDIQMLCAPASLLMYFCTHSLFLNALKQVALMWPRTVSRVVNNCTWSQLVLYLYLPRPPSFLLVAEPFAAYNVGGISTFVSVTMYTIQVQVRLTWDIYIHMCNTDAVHELVRSVRWNARSTIGGSQSPIVSLCTNAIQSTNTAAIPAKYISAPSPLIFGQM